VSSNPTAMQPTMGAWALLMGRWQIWGGGVITNVFLACRQQVLGYASA
jgi:hypothetical protein